MEEAAVHMAINPDGSLTIADFCKSSITRTQFVPLRFRSHAVGETSIGRCR